MTANTKLDSADSNKADTSMKDLERVQMCRVVADQNAISG